MIWQLEQARKGVRRRLARCLPLLGVMCWGSAAYGGVAHDHDLQWRTLRTPHFHIHFHTGLDALAARTADIAERAHERLSVTLQWSPALPTDVVLTDEVDFANGFTTPVPGNHIELWVTPPSDGLDEFGAWLEALITHEYVHVLHLDAVDSIPATWRKIFGRHPLLFPGLFQPDWIIEGYATYLEGDVEAGSGRGQSSYFDMLMRMEVAGGVKPLSQVNLPISTWPAGATRYLYGVEFMKFIAARYGEDALRHWINRYRGYLIPFKINANSRRVFKKTLTQLWGEFTQHLRQRYQSQIASVESSGLRVGQALSFSGYASGQTWANAEGTIYYVRADGRTPQALMRLRPGASQPELLAEVNMGARFDVHPRGGILIAQSDYVGNARIHFDLYRMSAEGQKLQRLTHGARFRHAIWSSEGDEIYAVRQAGGHSSLHVLDTNGVEQTELWRGTEDEVLSTIAANPRGDRLVTVKWQREVGWQLAEFDLAQRTWRVYPQPNVTPVDARYALEGESILFSADFDGVFNVWRLNTASGERQRLTRVIGGAFAPSVDAGGNLYYTGYQSHGFDVFRVEAAALLALPTEPMRVASSAPLAVVRNTVPTSNYTVTDYTPATGLAPVWWSPLWAFAEDLYLVGATTGGADPLRRHVYGLTAGYDFANNVPIGSFAYFYDGWRVIPQVTLSRDIGLHLSNGDTSAVTTSNSIEATLSWPFLKQRKQWMWHVGAVSDRVTVEYTAPGVVYRPQRDDQLLATAVSFNSTRHLPLSVSRGYGRDVSAVYEDSDWAASDYSGQVTRLDWREFFNPGGEHVVALRYVLGWGVGDPRPFQLGGALSTDVLFGSETVGASAPFNRRDYPLRGYADGSSQLQGRRMNLLSAEWRMPLSRVERSIMAPPLGLHQWFATFFTDVGATWNDGSSPEKQYVGSGIELNVDAALLYDFRVTLVAGYGHGWDRNIGEDQFYIRLGSAF